MREKPSYEELERRVKALEKEKAQYQDLLDNLNEIVYRVDSDARIKYISPNIERLTGFSSEELVGRYFTDFVHPDDFGERVEHFQDILSGKEFASEYRYRTKNRGFVWGYTKHKTIFENGKVVEVQGIMLDITERKEAEESLRKSEEKYRLLFNNTAFLVAIFNSEGICRIANRKAAAMFGVEPQEMAGKSFLELHPNNGEEYTRRIQEVLETGQINYYEDEVLFPEGKRWFFTEVQPVADVAGNFNEVQLLSVDITERKLAEEALRLSENYYRVVFDHASAAMCITEQDTTISQVNSKFEELTGGCTRKGLEGKRSWTEFVEPDDLAKMKKFHSLRRFDDETTPEGYEFRFIDGTGKTREGLLRIAMIPDTNQSLVSIVDITERKNAEKALRKSESKYRLLAEEAPISIMHFDKDGIVTFINRWHVEVFAEGKIGRDFFLNRRITELPGIQSAGIQSELEKILRGEMVFLPEVHIPKFAVGREGYQCIRGVPVFQNGSVVGGILIREDITEKKRADNEKEVLSANLQQTRKMEALGRMAGSVAHNFNNRLMVVLGHLELALEDLKTESAARENLEEALSACHHASNISNQMLAYLGHNKAKRKALDLSKFCQESLPDLQIGVNGNTRLEVDLRRPGPIVYINENDLKQALSGIILNAYEALEGSTGKITLRTRIVNPSEIKNFDIYPADWEPLENDYACLEITDQGCGINKDNLDKIFDPFFSTKFTGRGLGLPVALGTVKAVGGAVAVESRLGLGSSFFLFFPIMKEQVQHKHEKTNESRKNSHESNVLLVEDQKEVRQLAKKILQHLGYGVVAAENGHEAISIVKEGSQQIDCVLTDLSMPGMDGWETIASLKDMNSEIPVILASGYDETTLAQDKKRKDPDAFIQKPYQMAELKTALRQIMS